jgi:hypothetical protein
VKQARTAHTKIAVAAVRLTGGCLIGFQVSMTLSFGSARVVTRRVGRTRRRPETPFE